MSKAETQVLIVWREFLAGVKRRSRLIDSIKNAAVEPLCPTAALKEMLMELRQLSIKVVEDALEIEYRSQFGDTRPPIKGGVSVQLPSIDKFHTLEKKEDVLILAAMVTDIDCLFLLNKVTALLPVDFPTSRNPLMLGKTIDDLAELPIPTPEPGNSEQELRSLEFMRYKRACKALLKAEAQVLNKMPVLLEDIERVWLLKDQNSNINALIRVAATILDAKNHVSSTSEPQLSLLQGEPLDMEPAMFLRGLNKFRSGVDLPADVQAAVRQSLHNCDLSAVNDPSIEYIAEWVGVVVGTTLIVKRDLLASSTQAHSKSLTSMGESRVRSRGGTVGHEYSVATPEGRQRASSPHGRALSPDESISSPIKSRTQGPPSVSNSSRPERMSSTLGPGAIPSVTSPSKVIEKRAHKAKIMAEKADIKIASTIGAAKKQDSKRRAEIAKLKNAGGAAAADQGELNAIRYELIKMQQELLRRKILDPRHYKAASIDSQELLQQQKQANPTKETASSKKRTAEKIGAVRSKKANKTSKMAQNIPLAIQKVDWADHHGHMEIAIEPITDSIVVKYKASTVNGEDGTESVGTADETEALTMKISKLSLNRLIGKQVDYILEVNKDVRKMELMPLFEKFMESMAEYDTAVNNADSNLSAQVQGKTISQDLTLAINRDLISQEVTSGGVAMSVTISRDIECSGLIVKCVPQPGALRVQENTKFDTGPVTLFLHDKELQVLLINQRGLFNLAQTKWSCMIMIAQWIISRLRARRVPVFREHQITTGSEPGGAFETSIPDNVEEGNQNNRVEESSDTVSVDKDLVLVKEEQPVVASTDEEGAVKDEDAGPMLLEVHVDRTVDIADDVVALWQARNVPNLLGSSYSVSALQDLEMLNFTISLRIPDQVTGERLYNRLSEQKEAAKSAEAIAKQRARNKLAKGVRVYTLYDEDEEYDSEKEEEIQVMEMLTPEQILAQNATYTELTFTFSLMGIELLIFGSTELLDDMQKISSMKSKKAFQASKFMRNVLGRLSLHFKGHLAGNVYNLHTNVLDKSQWDITFDRRLFRDVRTISGGVLIVSASVIGSEILFDAHPTEGSIYRQVGSKLCTEDEIRNLVLEEGWPLDSLLPEHRVSLAFRILDTMKVRIGVVVFLRS